MREYKMSRWDIIFKFYFKFNLEIILLITNTNTKEITNPAVWREGKNEKLRSLKIKE